jgi:hypothetical protein
MVQRPEPDPEVLKTHIENIKEDLKRAFSY